MFTNISSEVVREVLKHQLCHLAGHRSVLGMKYVLLKMVLTALCCFSESEVTTSGDVVWL